MSDSLELPTAEIAKVAAEITTMLETISATDPAVKMAGLRIAAEIIQQAINTQTIRAMIYNALKPK